MRLRPLHRLAGVGGASVAVVIPFSSDGSLDVRSANGVLKVLKPDINERLEEEREIWSDLAAFVDERCERDGLPS
jgi:hypothetical protein